VRGEYIILRFHDSKLLHIAMANERTPLIQVVNIHPPRERYPHRTLRRFCTILLVFTCIAAFTLFLLPEEPIRIQNTAYTSLQQILIETPDESKAEEWSKYYTSGPHLAGKNLSQAEWTRDRWEEFGIQSEVVAYDVYINYPVGHRLALLEGDEVKHEFNLEEDVLEDDSTTGLEDRVPTFHGYSASGNVTAPYVYVNFGTFADFEDLIKANVSLEGKIAVAKYGRIFRGLKVKRAQELGMVGVVIYTDPQEDGDIIEENGYKPYPEGPARNPSSVQRGSVQFLSILPGDPTTPGYPSLPGAPRQEPFSIPSIPSLPISYAEAIPLLKALNGHGPKASDFNEWWQGGKLEKKGVQYHIGPTPSNIVLNLVNEQEYVTNPLWNVIGIINGTIQDEVVVLGNHRDACRSLFFFPSLDIANNKFRDCWRSWRP
jgi:N-acetylated-alpha-linked acidic dipeptidase